MNPDAAKDALAVAIDEATRLGATACDLFAVFEETLEVNIQDGQVDKLQRAATRPVGLRVFLGNRSAVASSSDWSAEGLKDLAANAVRMARLMQEDPAAGLPDEAPALSWDPGAPFVEEAPGFSPREGIALAKALEAVVLKADPRVAKTNGTSYDATRGRVYYLDSRGRRGAYRHAVHSLMAQPVAGSGSAMQTGYWHHAATDFAKLEPVETVGREAVRRTVRRLGARQVKSCRVPVVFEAQAAASLLGNLCQAINGAAVYRGLTFLAEGIGKALFPAGVRIVDDPAHPQGLVRRPFDGEGLSTRRLSIVEDGVLETFLLDAYSARRLKTAPTASAGRSPEGTPSPSPTNLYLEPGTKTPEEIVRSVDRGLYVTSLMGQGVNPVTGEYSRGAAGLWIEGGEFAHPVQEITISGDLRGIYRGIAAIGNDLSWRGAVTSPTLLVSEMTIAGS